ncbi:MAG: hypothetical protein HC769_19820 [Cyanobacteria bacterium CRU_2_1]|nr:hypothetical protein [Cyanobacteria bacterium CRU_2_1]
MEAQELKALIKQSVREVLQEEWFKFYEMLIPYISDEEQQEIEQEFGSPSNYDEGDFVDRVS